MQFFVVIFFAFRAQTSLHIVLCTFKLHLGISLQEEYQNKWYRPKKEKLPSPLAPTPPPHLQHMPTTVLSEKRLEMKRTPKCGQCNGCLTKMNCRKCNFCKDMKIYGGKGVLKQCCVERKCIMVSYLHLTLSNSKWLCCYECQCVSSSFNIGSKEAVWW